MIKEFVMKHPVISFFLADAIICNVINFGNNVLRTILACKGVKTADQVEEKKEEAEEEV